MEVLDSLQFNHDKYSYEQSEQWLNDVNRPVLTDYQKLRFDYEKVRFDMTSSNDLVLQYRELLKLKKRVPKDSLNLLFRVNDDLIYTYSSTLNDGSKNSLRDENCAIANKSGSARQLLICDYYKLSELESFVNNYEEAAAIIYHSISVADKNGLHDKIPSLEFNLAIIHDQGKHPDSAFFYFKKLLPVYEKKGNTKNLRDLYNNVGRAYQRTRVLDSAVYYLEKCLILQDSAQDFINRDTYLENLASTYYELNNFEKSARYYYATHKLRDSTNFESNSEKIRVLETKYQTAEKDLEIAERKALNEKNRTIIIALTAATAIILLFAILIYLNIRRKKQIADKARELEKQRADNLFKEQELVTLDAMIAGQESERKRISEDLHDNLGSSLTTIKLYFENLKNQNKDPNSQHIFDKTETLLAETYENVRTMSHARGNGLLASRGLIPAVQELAQRITSSNKLEFEVHHFGLDQRLENSVELTIFRVLQELTTNIVKHSKATEASINITSHTDSINIMIEDNGKGFNASPLPRKSGMGLSSIEKRVENMDGTFIVDSTPGRGTTITIDIPLS